MNDWTDAETRAQKARGLYEAGQWPQAARELRQAIEINPDNPVWYFNLGLALQEMRDYSAASEAFEQSLKLSPNDTEALNCLGVNMTRQGRYAEAIELFECIEEIDWKYEASYCNRIVAYTEIGQHDKAELMFYLARQVKDRCPLCYFNMGNSLYIRGMYDQAIACWRRVLDLDPAYRGAHARIGEAHWAKDELEEARKCFEAELADGGECGQVLVDLAELLTQMGQSDRAMEVFRRALAVDCRETSAYFGLGDLSARRGDLLAAEEYFRKVLAIDRTYPTSHARLGEVLLRRGLTKRACQQFDAELELCGSSASDLRSLGHLLLEWNQFERASTAWKKVTELTPEDPNAWLNLGISYLMTGDLETGIVQCRRALSLKEDYSLAMYNMALAYLRLGDVPSARHYASRAAELAEEHDGIQSLAKRLGVGSFWRRICARLKMGQ